MRNELVTLRTCVREIQERLITVEHELTDMINGSTDAVEGDAAPARCRHPSRDSNGECHTCGNRRACQGLCNEHGRACRINRPHEGRCVCARCP